MDVVENFQHVGTERDSDGGGDVSPTARVTSLRFKSEGDALGAALVRMAS